MTTNQYIAGFFVMIIAILVIDLLWLGVVAKNFYRAQLRGLMLDKPLWPAALLFYALFTIGSLYFVVSPAVTAHDAVQALWRGGLFGFFGYQLYDLTNLATLKNWPVTMVVVDIAWGTFLTGMTAFIAASILS
jgi:uncharacterized membrane protein